MAAYTYPLKLTFKLIALAPQIYVRDASGKDLLYVHQKLFKLKEAITVYRDSSKTETVFKIAADRVFDFRARYNFTDAAGRPLGAVKRKGARSLWRATYELFTDASEEPKLRIEEENPWIKVLDTLIGEIPVIGGFTGYFLNPTYLVKDAKTNQTMWKVSKHRSFLESQFTIERVTDLQADKESVALLGVLTMTLLERARG